MHFARWETFGRGRALLVAAVLLGSCASPIAGLWPPEPGAPTHRILVSVDAWHTVIAVWPSDDPLGEDRSKMREWGYADRHYYLNGDEGFWSSCAALFWPTDGIIHVAHVGVPYYLRSKTPPARHWWFELSESGYERLVAFLESEKASEDAVSHLAQAQWFESRYSYQSFHHCHHWAARALRAAGLPVWSTYALFRWSMVAQLDRAAGFVSTDSHKTP